MLTNGVVVVSFSRVPPAELLEQDRLTVPPCPLNEEGYLFQRVAAVIMNHYYINIREPPDTVSGPEIGKAGCEVPLGIQRLKKRGHLRMPHADCGRIEPIGKVYFVPELPHVKSSLVPDAVHEMLQPPPVVTPCRLIGKECRRALQWATILNIVGIVPP